MMKQLKLHSLLGFNSTIDTPPPTFKEKKNPKRAWRLNKKAKATLGVVLIAVILVSCYAFYPRQPLDNNPGDPTTPVSSTDPTANPSNSASTDTPTSPPQSNPTTKPTNKPITIDLESRVVTNSNGNLTKEDWKKIGAYAWKYFEENFNTKTGLPGTNGDFYAFTDWDLGCYIQAVMDAQTLNLISGDAQWTASARLDRVVWFLENRELNATTGYPFWFYQGDGTSYHENSDRTTAIVDIADTGRLFVALNNLKSFNSSLSNRIDNFVYNIYGNRSDYAALVPSVKAEGLASTKIYAYYVFSGFASFWPKEMSNVPDAILNNILSSNKFSYGNVTLPESDLSSEPLYCSIFETKNPPKALYTLAEKVYAAHETYYNITGKYRAFSEGPGPIGWTWESTVSGNRMWVITVNNQESDMTPIIYTKTAFTFLALYNRNFPINMCKYLESSLSAPTSGYYSGIDESGSVAATMLPSLLTNGVIIGAARYAVQNNF